jgi:carbamate kinase
MAKTVPSALIGGTMKTGAAGSMGPEVRAARWFAERTGGLAAIGSIDETQALPRGEAGTRIALETAVRAR